MYFIIALIIHLFGVCTPAPYEDGKGSSHKCCVCGKEIKEDK